MPLAHSLFGELNAAFGPAHIEETKARIEAASGHDTVDLAMLPEVLDLVNRSKLSPKFGMAWEEFFRSQYPLSLRKAINAAVAGALNPDHGGEPTPVVFAWEPHYESQLTITQSPAMQLGPNTISKPGLTVIIRSRYPTDLVT